MTLNDLLNHSCLIGLSYFDREGTLLRQVQHAGTVVNVDQKNGIAVRLNSAAETAAEGRIFTLPPLLDVWFSAPPGTYRDAEQQVLIVNPDFLVTWDIHQKQQHKQGLHEWWEWVPRAVPPTVG